MDHICSICNKYFSNKKNQLKHNRNIHGVYCIDKGRRRDEANMYNCKYCNKEYINLQSRWHHEIKCKDKIQEPHAKIEVTNEFYSQVLKNRLLEKELEHKNEIIKIQKKLLHAKRVDTKTFKTVNKILMDRSYNNNTINNNTYQILSLGNEELINVLTLEQKKQIMNSRLTSLEKIVEIAHCGDLNQYKNILITNLKDNYAYRYDESKGYFITIVKDDLLKDVIVNRVMDIEAIYDELKTANKINERTKKLIQDFLDKMDNNDNPFFDNETKYDNFMSYKKDRVKILLYNNQDKITKDIALLISNSREEEPPNDLPKLFM